MSLRKLEMMLPQRLPASLSCCLRSALPVQGFYYPVKRRLCIHSLVVA